MPILSFLYRAFGIAHQHGSDMNMAARIEVGPGNAVEPSPQARKRVRVLEGPYRPNKDPLRPKFKPDARHHAQKLLEDLQRLGITGPIPSAIVAGHYPGSAHDLELQALPINTVLHAMSQLIDRRRRKVDTPDGSAKTRQTVYLIPEASDLAEAAAPETQEDQAAPAESAPSASSRPMDIVEGAPRAGDAKSGDLAAMATSPRRANRDRRADSRDGTKQR